MFDHIIEIILFFNTTIKILNFKIINNKLKIKNYETQENQD